MTPKIKQILIILTISAMITIPLVSAAYVMTSNTVTTNGTAQATLTLAIDKTAFVQGDSVLLTATVSDQTSGLTITFNEGANPVGTATTNGQGIATLTLTPTVGSHTYSATGSHP